MDRVAYHGCTWPCACWRCHVANAAAALLVLPLPLRDTLQIVVVPPAQLCSGGNNRALRRLTLLGGVVHYVSSFVVRCGSTLGRLAISR